MHVLDSLMEMVRRVLEGALNDLLVLGVVMMVKWLWRRWRHFRAKRATAAPPSPMPTLRTQSDQSKPVPQRKRRAA